MTAAAAVIVPTNRPDSFRAWLDAWRGRLGDAALIVVEDAPERTPGLVPAGAVHVSHREIDADLGAGSWIISRRDSACRCYGLLLAHRLGVELAVTVDDDCFPVPGHDLVAGHRAALTAGPRWTSSVPGVRVRGLPYTAAGLGSAPGAAISVGLWRGVPDLDAPTTLARGCPADFAPPPGSWRAPTNQIIPICGMNLAFRREALPLGYFPLMGEGQPYRRFDDIWMGVVAQRICAHLGWPISVGEPHVRHLRASDPMANLVKEAPGIAANESFWRAVDAVDLAEATPAACMAEMGAGLAGHADPYLARLGRALGLWAGHFDAGPA
jgi:reversibly glycosylated polypeptide/UDP-arabinopyranose mutase